jgi:hypothetical protein
MKLTPLARAAAALPAALLVLSTGAVHAQSCRPLKMRSADLPGKTLEIYDQNKKYLRDATAKELGVEFTVDDCGDVAYYKIRFAGQDGLVRKIALRNINLTPIKCVCPDKSANPSIKTQGLPMAGEVNYCPSSQCPR